MKFYLFVATIIILNGKEIEVYCKPSPGNLDIVECTAVDNDACYDPVTKRWEPCFIEAGKI